MPTPPAFLAAFELKKGLVLENYAISKIKIKHEIIKEGQHYEFPTQLTFVFEKSGQSVPTNENVKLLIRALQTKLKILTPQTVYGQVYPYQCKWNEDLLGDTIVKEQHTMDRTVVILSIKGF